MSSTLKNLLFWVVLIVVGILIWNFSTNFQQRDTQIPFSQFMDELDKNNIEAVTIEGNYVSGTTRQQNKFRTFAPTQYDQLANQLIAKPRNITDSRDRTTPSEAASSPLTLPAGTGRPRVRRIWRSMSASYHMFSAPEAPAPMAMQSTAMAPMSVEASAVKMP